MTPVRSPSTRWIAWLLVSVALAYSGSLAGPFVFDDIPAIVQNPTLRHPGDWVTLLFPPGAEAGSVGGRPLVNLSLAFNFAIGGLAVGGYHLVNLLIHAGATLLLFGFARRTLARQPTGGATHPGAADATAFAIALLWAVHPVQTEAVTYVIQRAESLMALWYLLALYAFCRGVDSPLPRGWYALSWLACLLGMATKEVMVTAPVMVLLYDRAFVAGSFRQAWVPRRAFYLGLAATWIPLAGLVLSTHGRGDSAGYGSGLGLYPWLLTQAQAVGHYLRIALWPSPLVFDFGPATVHEASVVIGRIVLIAVLGAGTAVACLRRPALGFLGAWFFVILAPSSSLVPIATEPIAEHRLYLPLAAIVAAIVLGIARLLRPAASDSRQALFLAGIALLAASLAAATWLRNAVYRSDLSLWSDTVAACPGNPRALNNLGTALDALHRTGEAQAAFRKAVALDPSYLPAQYDLGALLLDDAKPDEAIPHLEKALGAPQHQRELRAYLADAYFAVGNTAAAARAYHRAAGAFAKAAEYAPDNARIRANLGNALLFAGDLDEAIRQYQAAVGLDPANPRLREMRDEALRYRASLPGKRSP